LQAAGGLRYSLEAFLRSLVSSLCKKKRNLLGLEILKVEKRGAYFAIWSQINPNPCKPSESRSSNFCRLLILARFAGKPNPP